MKHALTVVRGGPRGRRIATILTCLLLAGVGFAATAQAATYTVGVTSDSTGTCSAPSSGKCSLRQLINYENGLTSIPNPTDTIVVPTGGYFLSNGQLRITENVNIAGAGAQSVEIDQDTQAQAGGATAFRVFDIAGNAKVNADPTVTISGVTIALGRADSSNGFYGGNVLNQANLTLSEDAIEDGGTTSGSGAGISNDGGNLTLTHSLVYNNTSTAPNGGGDSGGIMNYGDDSVGAATLKIDNSTIVDNTSALGGGVFSWCAGANSECSTTGATNTTTITNSTIAFNNGGSRGSTGGGLLANQGTISVANSIVADNTVINPTTGGQTPSNCGGAITSLGDNLETATDCGFTASGDIQNTDPGFLTGGLQFHGGNTETFALSGTSPAVDAVPAANQSCAGTDQRDVARPQGTGCDIGAFELYQPVEGQQFTTVVGQVSGTSVSINWGDGTSSAGTTDSLGQVTGTHTYAEEGIYHAAINYRNSDGISSNEPFDVKVLDAPLTSTPAPDQRRGHRLVQRPGGDIHRRRPERHGLGLLGNHQLGRWNPLGRLDCHQSERRVRSQRHPHVQRGRRLQDGGDDQRCRGRRHHRARHRNGQASATERVEREPVRWADGRRHRGDDQRRQLHERHRRQLREHGRDLVHRERRQPDHRDRSGQVGGHRRHDRRPRRAARVRRRRLTCSPSRRLRPPRSRARRTTRPTT